MLYLSGENGDKEEFIRKFEKNESISRNHAHSVFIGPPGSGKSSLLYRLIYRSIHPSGSTGVADSVAIVNVTNAFHSVEVVGDNTWREVPYDASLVRQMNEENLTTSAPQPAHPPKLSDSGDTVGPPKTSSVQPGPAMHEEVAQIGEQLTTISSKTSSLSAEISRIFDSIQKEYGCFHKMTQKISLYLRDAGGHVEFQESISLLIFGPSIYFFVFRLDHEFQRKFSIEYRTGEGESTNCYTSSVTTEEALLQCLASVYAMDTSGKASDKTHKPLVFIIGTHKDKLGSSADDKIAALNEQLDSLLLKSGFEDLVQHADASKGQIMFTVDNTSKNDEEDFDSIRSKVSCLISRDDFTIEYPARYLLFCFVLQSLESKVMSLEKFKGLAAKYGIMGDQVSHLLQFLHLRVGVIQYFNVDGLKHIVFRQPQFLFGKVTKLLTGTFLRPCHKSLTTEERKDLEKGILTPRVLKNIIGSDEEISLEELTKILVHLHILVPYPSSTVGEQEERYFIPCVLNMLKSPLVIISTRIFCHCMYDSNVDTALKVSSVS
jgi:GTPase SAR1 family protein